MLPLTIFSLAIGAFAIGVAEFVIMGLLPIIANEFNVSLDIAGWLITGYAFGVAFGAPVIMLFLLKTPAKRALLILMAIFTLGNVISALASSYSLLMISRVIASLAHGCFFGIGSIVASKIVSEDKKASAIALMFGGLTIANIVGVPIGTFIGQNLGWRVTFWFVASLGIITFLAVQLCIPKLSSNNEATNLKKELSEVIRFKVVLGFLMTITTFGGVFTTLTYLAPILTDIGGFKESAIGWVLLLFGLGVTIGNILGGKMWDKYGLKSLFIITFLLILNQIIFYGTIFSKPMILINIFWWGIMSFATVAGLQMYVVKTADKAPNLASTLNISAFNLGNGLGAILGGYIIKYGYSLKYIPLVAAGVTFIGLLLICIAIKMNSRNLKTFTI